MSRFLYNKSSSEIGNYTKRRSYSFYNVPKVNNNDKVKRVSAHEYEKIIRKLLEKIDVLEEKLKVNGLNRIKLVSHHKEISTENFLLKSEMEKAAESAKEMDVANKKNEKKIENLTKSYNDFRSSYQSKLALTLREMSSKEEKIEDLSKIIRKKDEKIKEVLFSYGVVQKQMRQRENELELMRVENEVKGEKIRELEEEVENLYLNKRSEGNLLMENKHLKDDNIRLLGLLKTTSEFKDFAFLNETLPGGIRYTEESSLPIGPRARKEAAGLRRKNLDAWVPALAYEKIVAFKDKYKFNMTESLINELLGQLSSVFREKEERNLEKVRLQFQKKIVNLMTKYGIKNIEAPYNVTEVEEIKRRVGRKDNAESRLQKMTRESDLEGSEIVNFAKTCASNFFSGERKELEEQIEDLKFRLTMRSQEASQVGGKGKVGKEGKEGRLDVSNGLSCKTSSGRMGFNLYIDKVIKELNFIERSLTDLTNEISKRNKEAELEHNKNSLKNSMKILENNYKWLIESLRKVISERRSLFVKMNILDND